MKRRHSPEVGAYAALGAAVQAVAIGLLLALLPSAHAAALGGYAADLARPNLNPTQFSAPPLGCQPQREHRVQP